MPYFGKTRLLGHIGSSVRCLSTSRTASCSQNNRTHWIRLRNLVICGPLADSLHFLPRAFPRVPTAALKWTPYDYLSRLHVSKSQKNWLALTYYSCNVFHCVFFLSYSRRRRRGFVWVGPGGRALRYVAHLSPWLSYHTITAVYKQTGLVNQLDWLSIFPNTPSSLTT